MTSVSIFDENESLIYDLYMNQHLTSKEIAEKIGCNRNGLKAFIARKGWKRKFIKTCLFCGKQFETDREHSKFCSEECRLKKLM